MSVSANPLELDFFKKQSMERKKCTSCSSFFWTTDPNRKTCGDPPCDQYGFIGKPPTSREYSLDEMRKEFLGFFSGTHTIVQPYPVVPRWRDDVLLVNASIYDFQPQVTSGVVSPPGNPIVMSQPCIRMNDIDQVGVTGRHLTSFEMLCHDSFNREGREIYWKDETVKYCNSFLTGPLGISQDLITYKEKPWSGGGNAGNALEVFVLGLEVATLVFMDMSEDENGTFEVEGKKYSPMPQRIVDTGYGLERLVWLSKGTPTVYDSIFPNIMSGIIQSSGIKRPDDGMIARIVTALASDESAVPRDVIKKAVEGHSLGNGGNAEETMKDMERLMAAFILSDHSRTLLFMFSDYVIPSNVKVGYLARLLIRRSLRFIGELGLHLSLSDLIRLQMENIGELRLNYPSAFIDEVIAEEMEKYTAALRRGESVLRRIIEKEGKIDEGSLLEMYDSYGIYPEFAAGIYRGITGRDLAIPHNFQALVVSRHDAKKRKDEVREKFPDLFTRPLYYDDVSMREFTASVIHSGKNYVILDQTAFYPEGGGQPYDLGVIVHGGREIRVTRVEKHGRAIVHYIEGSIPEKSRVKGVIDYERRWQLMVHHSATHLLLGVMRKIVGEHVWQNGVQKEVNESRIDITNYKKIDKDLVLKIEMECHRIITESRKITVKNIEWNHALGKYGFRLFQGGVPLSDKLRVVEIDGVDAEGCGGTHLSLTSQIGILKIKSIENIQEGTQRVTFVAGPAAVNLFSAVYNESNEISSVMGKHEGSLLGNVRQLVEENIEMRKQHEKILKQAVKVLLDSGTDIDVEGFRIRFIRGTLEKEAEKDLSRAAYGMEADAVIVMLLGRGTNNFLLFSRGKISAAELGKMLGLPANGQAGSERFFRAESAKDIDENLIREVFHSKL